MSIVPGACIVIEAMAREGPFVIPRNVYITRNGRDNPLTAMEGPFLREPAKHWRAIPVDGPGDVYILMEFSPVGDCDGFSWEGQVPPIDKSSPVILGKPKEFILTQVPGVEDGVYEIQARTADLGPVHFIGHDAESRQVRFYPDIPPFEKPLWKIMVIQPE
ncbi:hypothetical protein BD779DRAFT_1678399 [Infundibulicybe gibba]|nr:hypothetical protein BD779DRAFT_1678399 [Infundibulicybe gibba]